MEEEETRHYREPCPQCSDINWGITDESKFYCKSCHTVIEKTTEVDECDTFSVNAKVQSFNRGLRKRKKSVKGWEWFICEGFQFILLKQAEALLDLGVDARLKDDVMCNLWRRYLIKSNQAYTKRPRSGQSGSESQASASETDTELDAFSFRTSSFSESDGGCVSDTNLPSSSGEGKLSGSESAVSVQSGSIDGGSYLLPRSRSELKMSMPMTLAFCYLSLLWLRESITLSDLLRFVFSGHVPYVKAEQYLPEENKMYGPDIHIFYVKAIPEYRDIMDKCLQLGAFLDLPCFPPITENCFLHPNVLCMKYLMEANLPDELHKWTNRVVKKTGLDDITVLTFDPVHKKRNIPYDVTAAALIIVVLKLLFVLDDRTEWLSSTLADERNFNNEDKPLFDIKKWYEVMKLKMDEGQRALEEERARFSWKSNKVLYYTESVKALYSKKKQMAADLQRQFSKLAEAASSAGKQNPSSFVFNWDEENTGMTCFHGHSLEGITQQGEKRLNKGYWLSCIKKCTSWTCEHWRLYDKSKFSRSYHFVLSLFAFLLRLPLCTIHYEVCSIEEKLFKRFLKKPAKPKPKQRKK
ncbi:TATA box-binding protein-associated factor RNA polymerase I subunit B [Spea bombifrons]|uniref:TATA box-binding protein-associated factor RNA polymerase I subunit B n=1 Tax=Spea bombifrons TaxID=233779 RepID=UPI00234AF8ED|nr:TATA box-binding protein-associated factor RNA polymerase I subunit B [Spea bombifrons]